MAKQSLDELIEQSEEAIEKGEDLSEIEAEHHHKVKEETKSKEEKIESKIKERKFEKDNKINQDDQVNQENKENQAEEKKPKVEEAKKVKKIKKGKEKIRSKKYQQAKALIEANKKYEILEAIELVKKTSITKFDGNVEIHLRLLAKSGKPEQARGLLKYPHATGKKTAVVILNDKVIEEVNASGKAPADIYLATPENMPKIARLAKILGPKGKMPNPKAGTITTDPEKTKKDLEAGQTEYKTDAYGIIHQTIGKVSAKSEELVENFKALLDVLPSEKIFSINLCVTMGPAIKVQK